MVRWNKSDSCGIVPICFLSDCLVIHLISWLSIVIFPDCVSILHGFQIESPCEKFEYFTSNVPETMYSEFLQKNLYLPSSEM